MTYKINFLEFYDASGCETLQIIHIEEQGIIDAINKLLGMYAPLKGVKVSRIEKIEARTSEEIKDHELPTNDWGTSTIL